MLTSACFRNTFLAGTGVSVDTYGETEEMVSIKPSLVASYEVGAGKHQRDYNGTTIMRQQ